LKGNQLIISFQQKIWFKIDLNPSYITLERDTLVKTLGKELGFGSFLSEALSALAAGETLQGLRNPCIIVR
jgi:hypothetical protein